MVIAFDAFSTGNDLEPGTSPLTWTHTCSGSDRLLLVIGKGNGVVTSITYNGVSLTKLASAADSSYGTLEIWGLLNPASGSNTVQVNWTGSQFVSMGSVSYTGVAQSGLPDATASNTNQTSVTSIATSITVVKAQCWIVAATICQGGFTITAGTGQTKRYQGLSDNYMVGDSNGGVSPGSNSLTTNFSGTVASSSMVMVSIAPKSSGGFFAFL